MSRRKQPKFIGQASAFAAALLTSVAATPANAKVFIFGDSYSDNGNQNIVTGGNQPGPQYWAGRFTNGWTLAERLTFRLTNESPGLAPGLNSIQYPPGTRVAGGIDFAHGGATAVTRSTLPRHLSIVNQANYFRNQIGARRITVSRSDSALIWAGLNDYLTYNATNAVSVSDTVVNSIVMPVALSGVGNVLVLNLPNMGDLPGWIGGSRRTSLNSLTSTHNANLSARLVQRQASTTAKLILVDVNRALLLAHQGIAGGFTVTRPGQNGSASGNCLGDGKVMWDCTANYLYYDFVHLNWSGHEYLTSIVQDRLNSARAQTAQARTSSVSVSVATSGQSQALSARLGAAQQGYSGILSFGGAGADASEGSLALTDGASVSQLASLGGSLSMYSYGDAAFSEDVDDRAGQRFGFGADWTQGSWIAGASAFRSSPGPREWTETPDFELRQELDGASAYLAWVAPEASLSLQATHARGVQDTVRVSAVMGLPRAWGRTDVSANSLQASATVQDSWGGLTVKGDAALVFDDLQVAAFQESGTLGLSDTAYDAVDQRGLTGRIGASLSYRTEDAEISVSGHYLSRLSGNASVWTALPVAIPGYDVSQTRMSLDASHEIADRAAVASVSASWKWSAQGSVNFGAAAVATGDGEVTGGLSVGANYRF